MSQPNQDTNNIYFAAKSGNELAAILDSKAQTFYQHLYSSQYINQLRSSWNAYEGSYYASMGNPTQISYGGEQGELVNLAINHYRNIADHMISLIMANRPAFEARSANTDQKSLIQTKLANALLDYYMHDKKLESYLEMAIRYAVVLGSGFIKMSWNSLAGQISDIDEAGQPVREGDIEFQNLSPFDVYFDGTKEDTHFDWVVCRSFKNKFDLMAKYPEHADRILGLETKTNLAKFSFSGMAYESTDDIAVYEFFHRKTESMPEGKYFLYLSSDITLMETPLPYRAIPLFRVSPANILGTPYGTSTMFQLLPIQEAINSLYSTVLTNQSTFGVQNVYVPRGSDISVRSLEGGLNLVEGNANAGKPEALNLTQTPVEIFNFIKTLEQQMEIISGMNSVIRGSPEASLKSGTALATVQSTALQFISPLQMAYINLVESMGTGIIEFLQDFADLPRIALIAGRTNKSYVKTEFNADDLLQINRVIITVGNPLAATTAGKTQIAENLLQYQLLKSPHEYFQILKTGNLDVLTDDATNELLNIKKENEYLLDGKQFKALAIDMHIQHINEHRGVISDPEMRLPGNEALVQNVLKHIMEHIQLLETTNPALLNILGMQSLQQPPPEAQGSAGAPMGPNGNQPPEVRPASPARPPNGAPANAQENMERLVSGQQ